MSSLSGRTHSQEGWLYSQPQGLSSDHRRWAPWVCEQCGKPLFDEETVDAIQEMLSELDLRLEKLAEFSAAA
jgi:hypothetical protein